MEKLKRFFKWIWMKNRSFNEKHLKQLNTFAGIYILSISISTILFQTIATVEPMGELGLIVSNVYYEGLIMLLQSTIGILMIIELVTSGILAFQNLTQKRILIAIFLILIIVLNYIALPFIDRWPNLISRIVLHMMFAIIVIIKSRKIEGNPNKKGIIVVPIVLGVILCCLTVGRFPYFYGIKNQLLKELEVNTVTLAYKTICLQNLDGIWEYVTEKGEVLLEVQADKCTPFVSMNRQGKTYTLAVKVVDGKGIVISQEGKEVWTPYLSKGSSLFGSIIQSQAAMILLGNEYSNDKIFPNTETITRYQKAYLVEEPTFPTSRYELEEEKIYEYYLCNAQMAIQIVYGDELEYYYYFASNYEKYEKEFYLINIKNQTRILLACENLVYKEKGWDEDAYIKVYNNGYIPFEDKNKYGYFKTKGESIQQVEKVVLGETFKAIDFMQDKILIQQVTEDKEFNFFFVNNELQRISPIYDSIEYLSNGNFVVTDKERENAKITNRNLDTLTPLYYEIATTEFEDLLLAVTYFKDGYYNDDENYELAKSEFILINANGKKLNDKKYKDYTRNLVAGWSFAQEFIYNLY